MWTIYSTASLTKQSPLGPFFLSLLCENIIHSKIMSILVATKTWPTKPLVGEFAFLSLIVDDMPLTGLEKRLVNVLVKWPVYRWSWKRQKGWTSYMPWLFKCYHAAGRADWVPLCGQLFIVQPWSITFQITSFFRLIKIDRKDTHPARCLAREGNEPNRAKNLVL